MFTPPPSPAPPRGRRDLQALSSVLSSSSPTSSSLLSPSSCISTPPSSPSRSPSPCPLPARLHQKQPSRAEQHRIFTTVKKRIGHRTRWTILLVPAALVLIALSTRYISHPAALDALSPDQPPRDWHAWATTLRDWQPHKRHPFPDPAPQGSGETISVPSVLLSSTLAIASSSGSAVPSITAIGSASPATPTIPAGSAVLPTPFPQPLDSTLSQNFSTDRCESFLVNMTQSLAFRQCRPLGMLLQSSTAFSNAQTNVTLMNDIIWGTCNTPLSEDQCIENMEYFYTDMQTACSVELSQRNVQTTSTLLGLQTYLLMRETACLANSTTNVYCYIEALAGGDATVADQELYYLPLGTPLPNNSVLSCSRCSQRVLMAYVDWAGNVTGFRDAYESAAELANRVCGSGYVSELATTSTNGVPATRAGWMAVVAAMLAVAAVAS